MTRWLCATCSTQYPDSAEPPDSCPICEDPRQYVPESGQAWTTLDELREAHRPVIREELPGLLGIGCEPSFAIGQRALKVGGVLWDCQALLDDEIAAAVGGLDAIAISHPHYYSTMVEWAHAFDCPILIHEDDREWIMRPRPGDRALERRAARGRTRADAAPARRPLRRRAGIALGRERRTLLSGDIVQVIPDRSHVGFMYSYPNLIPLPPAAVREIARRLEPWDFETIVGAWWGRVVRSDGAAVVQRSAKRYVAAVEGRLTP